MIKFIQALRVFAIFCYCIFVCLCGSTLTVGFVMIWRLGDNPGVLFKIFLASFLGAVVFGLLVSGTRAMLGVIREGAEDLDRGIEAKLRR